MIEELLDLIQEYDMCVLNVCQTKKGVWSCHLSDYRVRCEWGTGSTMEAAMAEALDKVRGLPMPRGGLSAEDFGL
jgi:hypothetical protein